jgi:2-keto-3-deoxy-L-rhamnonate aldolase RhmA
MLVVVMIESPTGVATRLRHRESTRVDVVILGNNDLSVFSGFAQDDDRYQALVKKVHDDTLRAGKIFGQANANYAKGHPLSNTAKFFQNGPSNDGWKPPNAGRGNPNAPPEGEEDKPGAAKPKPPAR